MRVIELESQRKRESGKEREGKCWRVSENVKVGEKEREGVGKRV